MKKILILLLIGISTISFAQQTPAKKQTNAITIVGATAHLGTGKVIENSLIIFENGKFTVVADATMTKIAYRGEIIQAEGKHIYPGFILPNSTIGLGEIDAVKATLDFQEMGNFKPHIRSIIAYNPESKVTETLRANGILFAQVTPRGGRISGTSTIVQLDAWNYEDAIIKEDDGIHLNWPESFRRSGWWAEPGSIAPNKNYVNQVQQIKDFFNNSKADNSTSIDLKSKSMQGLFTGTKTLFVHVNGEREMVEVIDFKNKLQLKKIVIVGGFEAYKITDLLRENNIPIILKRIHALPTATDQDIKLPFKMPYLLQNAGLLVALEVDGGRMERMQSRNLPFYAGTAIAYGLDYEKAVAMLTLNPAKILGVDDKIGSIEVNKDASFIISSGDVFDMRTSNIEKAYINGRTINLDTHQKRLYRKFSKKYSQK